MSRSGLLILLGVVTAFMPFSGLPSSWFPLLLPLLGLPTAAIGFAIRASQVREAKERGAAPLTAAADEPAAMPHGVSPI